MKSPLIQLLPIAALILYAIAELLAQRPARERPIRLAVRAKERSLNFKQRVHVRRAVRHGKLAKNRRLAKVAVLRARYRQDVMTYLLSRRVRIQAFVRLLFLSVIIPFHYGALAALAGIAFFGITPRLHRLRLKAAIRAEQVNQERRDAPSAFVNIRVPEAV